MIVDPTPKNIKLAALALSDGKLIGLPTETVYGLAANALNVDAVKAVFRAKGRPADNPLIVHCASVAKAKALAAIWISDANLLAETYWPGPLTIVVSKQNLVPDSVTAGLDSVALRIPQHPVARALLEACDFPLAAPSANRFMGLSPVRVEQIEPEIASAAAFLLDGGRSEVGLESTVLDLTQEQPVLLRPGAVTREQIENTLGKPILDGTEEAIKRSPGLYKRHYAPRTPVELVARLQRNQVGLSLSDVAPPSIRMPNTEHAYAAELYDALHRLDALDLTAIYVEMPPRDWEAVWDRLRKATG